MTIPNPAVSRVDVEQRTDIEQDIWRRFFVAAENCWDRYHAIIHPHYLENVHLLRPFRENIPTLVELDRILASIGWKAAYVEGFAPPWETARMLDNHIMPLASFLRDPDELYFGSEPDFIHDLFGHLPMLMHEQYRALLAEWSHAASRVPVETADQARFHIDKLVMQSKHKVSPSAFSDIKTTADSLEQFMRQYPSPTLTLEKTYTWIFEFGILEQQGELKVLGAGLLSSLSELEKLATTQVKTALLDSRSIFTPYNVAQQQECYLTVPSWECYGRIIAEARV